MGAHGHKAPNDCVQHQCDGPAIDMHFCLPNTRFLIHQPSGIGGKAADIAIQAQEIVRGSASSN
jgi:hypothetical protein